MSEAGRKKALYAICFRNWSGDMIIDYHVANQLNSGEGGFL